MKFKMAVPSNVLNGAQIDWIEALLASKLLGIIVKNFPDWKSRADDGSISGGEIILQQTDMVRPMKGLKAGIHLTISLISFKEGRDFGGLARDTIALIKETQDEAGQKFMLTVDIFVQMTLDRPVVKAGTEETYTASGDGLNLLEYSS